MRHGASERMNILKAGLAIVAAATIVISMPALAAGKVCDVKSYGAKGDGTTKDTRAIQAAIDDCAKTPSSTVTLSGGTFVSAPVVLKSNMTLNIDKGATLLGSPDHADYPAISEFRASGTQSLVRAANAENIAITGSGIIDGNGESWWTAARATKDHGVVGVDQFRPRLVRLAVVVPLVWVVLDEAGDVLSLARDGATVPPHKAEAVVEVGAERTEFEEQGIGWKRATAASGTFVYAPTDLAGTLLTPGAYSALGLV